MAAKEQNIQVKENEIRIEKEKVAKGKAETEEKERKYEKQAWKVAEMEEKLASLALMSSMKQKV